MMFKKFCGHVVESAGDGMLISPTYHLSQSWRAMFPGSLHVFKDIKLPAMKEINFPNIVYKLVVVTTSYS